MPWEITDDIEVYAERAWPLLVARPAENTIPLTVIETVRAGHRWSDEAMVFGWYDEGRVSGAVSLTPPYELLLAVMPDGSVEELAAELHAREVSVPGVHGEAGDVERFAAALAGRHATATGVARVAPVYTPPENRRCGYGAAVTAACTSDALHCGAQQVVLFTDLANPTSNAIYQRIGYRPVSDRTIVRFRQ